MHSKIQGFEVTVTVDDGKPHLRVSFGPSGELVLDTNALSIRGLENMAIVFERAAKMAYTELDDYWRKEHATLRASEPQPRCPVIALRDTESYQPKGVT